MATATADAREKKRKITDVDTPVVSLLTPSPPPPDAFVPLSQVPTSVESPEGECFLHTTSVIRRSLLRRQNQICRKLTSNLTQQQNQIKTKQQSKTSTSLPAVHTPESTQVLVRRIADNRENAMLDPGFCTDCCPYSTGGLCAQRFEMLKRIYQITRALESVAREFSLFLLIIIYSEYVRIIICRCWRAIS